ncbi:MAG: transglutaminase TgpA family protein, partial [Actinomycetota bacterium]
MNRRLAYLGLAALSAGSLAGLSRDFADDAWMIPVYGTAFAALGLLALLRSLGLPWFLRYPLALVVGFFFLGLAIVPDTIPPGLIPLPTRMFEFARQAWNRSLTEFTPVIPENAYIFLAAAATWIAVMISEALALSGHPIFSTAPWLALLAYTSATGVLRGRQVSVFTFLLGFIVFLLLAEPESGGPSLREAPSGRMLRGSAILGGASILAGLFMPFMVPGYGAPGLLSLEQPGGLRTEISPLVQIRPRLTEARDIPVFTVRSDAVPRGFPLYWRLMALERFNGRAWHSEADYQGFRRIIRSREPVVGPRLHLAQTYEIQQLAGPWMPAAYQPLAEDGVKAAVDPRTSSLVVGTELRQGMSYRITSQLPVPTVDDLGNASIPVGFDDYLELEGVSPEVRQIAFDLTSDRPTPYQKVLAISEHLRRFKYDESVEPGHSADELLTFLTVTRAGYCEQFAGSMAVLVRAIGIPARVAVGFLPGTYDSATRSYQVTTTHAHAWPEVYFEGVGWVPFEPTPRDIAVPPSYATVATGPDLSNVPLEDPIPADEPVAPALTASPPAAPPPTVEIADPAGSERSPWTLVALVPLIVLAAASGIAIAKRVRTSLRYRRAHSASDRARAAFAELEATAADVLRPRRADQTPHEFVREMRRAFGLEAQASDQVASTFSMAAYGAEAPLDESAEAAWRAVHLLRAQVWKKSDWRRRAALVASPRS